jgi:hypothetical protein
MGPRPPRDKRCGRLFEPEAFARTSRFHQFEYPGKNDRYPLKNSRYPFKLLGPERIRDDSRS